jgi:catechol 2,3-dioxygenase-like lactoylglutathione lyase family enzyme
MSRERHDRGLTIIDHVNIPVRDLERARRFYQAVLGPLGYRAIAQDGRAFGFGRSNWNFGVVETPPPFPSLHLAFVAPGPRQVDEFFAVALREGARSNGEPGLRDSYQPGYYAAFVLDPDGHNLEAVFRGGDGAV